MTARYRPKMLWITRSAPFGLAIARECGSEGIPALAVPVLHIRPLAVSRPDEVPDAILFTSAQGVRLHPFDPRWKDVAVLTVGDATAEQAMAKGYSDVRSAAGDVEDLKALTAATLSRRARILLFSVREPAGDLDRFLRRGGYLLKRCTVYESRGSTDAELRHASDLLDRIDGICIYSPKGAKRVSELLRRHPWRGTIFCLSPACAAQIEPQQGIDVLVADRPDDHSLRHLVRRTWRMSETPPCEDARQPPKVDLRDLSSATRQGVANDNRNVRARQFAGAPEGGDEDPPPSAA